MSVRTAWLVAEEALRGAWGPCTQRGEAGRGEAGEGLWPDWKGLHMPSQEEFDVYFART